MPENASQGADVQVFDPLLLVVNGEFSFNNFERAQLFRLVRSQSYIDTSLTGWQTPYRTGGPDMFLVVFKPSGDLDELKSRLLDLLDEQFPHITRT